MENEDVLVAEFVDMAKIKELVDLDKTAADLANKFEIIKGQAENAYLKLQMAKLTIKMEYKLSDTDTIDINSGVISRK